MSRASRWLDDARRVQLLRALADRPGKRQLGWALLDGNEPTELIWVHLRQYLEEPGLPPGVRVEPDPATQPPLDLLWALPARSAYKPLILRHPAGDLAAEVLELLNEAQQRDLAWHVLEVGDDLESAVLVGENGERTPLREPAAWEVQPLLLRFDDPEPLDRRSCLPFDLTVSSRHARSTISVRLLERSPRFRRRDYEFVVDDPRGEPLGAGVLRIDARLRPGQPDEIQVPEPSEFGRQIRVAPQPRRPSHPRRFRKMLLHLHVLYDRTTLDVDAWPLAALATATGEVEEGAAETIAHASPATGKAKATAGNWNRQWRVALAHTLPLSLPRLHDHVAIHLWWFADLPRTGIAAIEGLAVARAWDQWGQCPPERLEAVLSGTQFDYRPGLDVVDAVDEALIGIAERVRVGVEQRNEQHAVLIVGDSPPPPARPGDGIWTHLVDWPPRTNSRCSPAFGDALTRLREQDARLGWLFVRNSRAPQEAGRGYEELYGIYHSMKEQTLEAVRAAGGDDLSIESCNGPEDVGRGLDTLFASMVEGRGPLPRFRIRPD